MSNIIIIILGFLVIFFGTTLGSSLVFFFRRDINPKLNTVLLGFAGGVMIAASIFSLIIPSIESVDYLGKFNFVPAAGGILVGGLFMVLLDKITPHFHPGINVEEGPKSRVNKSMRLFLTVTMHNIPEGLAVGFAFGSAKNIGTTEAYIGALSLAIGIAIQNFPEGACVSLPLLRATDSKGKSFVFGMMSGIVEPIAAVLGFLLVSSLVIIQPYLLAFAAGAMLFVVVEDLIPDAHLEDNPHLGTWGIIIGFITMMCLDIALG